jgi:hypothetical protein
MGAGLAQIQQPVPVSPAAESVTHVPRRMEKMALTTWVPHARRRRDTARSSHRLDGPLASELRNTRAGDDQRGPPGQMQCGCGHTRECGVALPSRFLSPFLFFYFEFQILKFKSLVNYPQIYNTICTCPICGKFIYLKNYFVLHNIYPLFSSYCSQFLNFPLEFKFYFGFF